MTVCLEILKSLENSINFSKRVLAAWINLLHVRFMISKWLWKKLCCSQQKVITSCFRLTRYIDGLFVQLENDFNLTHFSLRSKNFKDKNQSRLLKNCLN